MNLTEQIAVVTGGASGLGRSCVEYLHDRGAVVVVWDKNCTDAPDFAIKIECDVSSAESVEEGLKKTINDLGIGTPRICINCAGVAPARKILDKTGVMPLDIFKEVLDINLLGTFNVMRVMANVMSTLTPLNSDKERGVIINTASIAAFEGQVGQTAYSASKAGIVGLTLPAARELAHFGIRVNTIAPGIFATPLLLNMPENIQQGLIDNIPFPKRLGIPEEFASLAGYIIENSFLNGEVIRIDGALRMQSGIRNS